MTLDGPLRRLLIVVAAAALLEVVAWQTVPSFGTLAALAGGAVAYRLTMGQTGRPRGELKYWRGRPIVDDDPPKRRWN
ncbi:MAG: hypothetical protein HY071_02715 [Chloroflexi bacterium]|nr:hypothetical protein [Chloroflexota bacterium]